MHDRLEAKGCVHQSRHGMERPGWFINGLSDTNGDDTSVSPPSSSPSSPPSSPPSPPLPYDYYGAYADGGWRIEEGREDEPKHVSNPYLGIIEGELTFGWPSSHFHVAEECRATREGAAIYDQSYFGNFFLTGPQVRGRQGGVGR